MQPACSADEGGRLGSGPSASPARSPRAPTSPTSELLGDSKRVAADHYVYALTDYREVDKQIALARVRVQNG